MTKGKEEKREKLKGRTHFIFMVVLVILYVCVLAFLSTFYFSLSLLAQRRSHSTSNIHSFHVQRNSASAFVHTSVHIACCSSSPEKGRAKQLRSGNSKYCCRPVYLSLSLSRFHTLCLTHAAATPGDSPSPPPPSIPAPPPPPPLPPYQILAPSAASPPAERGPSS